MDSHMSPLVQVSRDSQVTWPCRDYPRIRQPYTPPYPNILGFPSNLAIRIIPGWTAISLLLFQVSRDSQVTWSSRDYPWMAMLLWNPGILVQGGHMAVHPTCRIIPGWPGYLGIPGYLDKGEGIWLSILG